MSETTANQITSLPDVERALKAAGYPSHYDPTKSNSLVFLLDPDTHVAVNINEAEKEVSIYTILTPVESLSEEKLPELLAEMLSNQLAVAPFSFAILPDGGSGGDVALICTQVLTQLDDGEFVAVVQRLPSTVVTGQQIIGIKHTPATH